jgi:hypothetical protein
MAAAAADLDRIGGEAPASATTTATTRPTGGKAKRKKTDKEKKEEEDEAKKARSATLLAAMDRVGQAKEDADSKFCDYLCELLRALSPSDRTEAHMQLFQVVMNFSARQ